MRTKTVSAWQASSYLIGASGGAASDSGLTTATEVQPDTGNAGSMNPYTTTNFVIKT